MLEHLISGARSSESTTLNEQAPTELEARSPPRSSMFLAAVLRAGDEHASVKVRNMSPNGAMLETSLVPPPGTNVHLIRGTLIAQGTIIWSSSHRCGLRFSCRVAVKEWLAAPTTPEQHRVDEIVSLVRAGEVSTASGVGNCDEPSSPRTDEQLVDDLRDVGRLMQDLEDDLASSKDTLARHEAKLQNLDIAMQMIRAIGQELTPAHQGKPTCIADLENLRIVCAQALGIR
jgi:hypothetical protein